MPLFHSGYKQMENWNQPEVEEIVKSALLLRDGINKLAKVNTWELNATVRVNSSKFALLRVSTLYNYNILHLFFDNFSFLFNDAIFNICKQNLQKEKESSTSELCEIVRVSSITLIEDEACTDLQIELEPTNKELCKRCRRHPISENEEVCFRCNEIINSSCI